jgi:hypothetical protein
LCYLSTDGIINFSHTCKLFRLTLKPTIEKYTIVFFYKEKLNSFLSTFNIHSANKLYLSPQNISMIYFIDLEKLPSLPNLQQLTIQSWTFLSSTLTFSHYLTRLFAGQYSSMPDVPMIPHLSQALTHLSIVPRHDDPLKNLPSSLISYNFWIYI